MRNLLIILGLAIGLGAAGWVGTMMVAQRRQNAAADERERQTAGKPRDMTDASRAFGDAAGDMSKRQTYAMIGGGVGVGVGLVAGIGLATYLDRKKVVKRR